MRHFLSWYIHICFLSLFSYLIPFDFTEEKKPTWFLLPFLDRLALEGWVQHMACWKTHLAQTPAGKLFFLFFCDQQDKRHWFNKKNQTPLVSVQVQPLHFWTELVSTWQRGGIPPFCFPSMKLHWHQHSVETRKQNGNKSLDVESTAKQDTEQR